MEFWRDLLEELRLGHRVFLAMVVENSRHSPGTAGARLFLSASGDLAGTIGGGIMEHQLLEQARRALAPITAEASSCLGRPPQLVTLHHRSSGPGEKSGMVCAGWQTNLYYLCDPPRDREPVEELVRSLREDRASTLRIRRAGMAIEEGLDLAGPQRSLRWQGRDWSFCD